MRPIIKMHMCGKDLNKMYEIDVQVNGMMCGMCESHINEAVRRAFPKIKKVASSRSKNQTVIITEDELDQDAVRKAIADTGYEVGEIEVKPYEKKGLFGKK